MPRNLKIIITDEQFWLAVTGTIALCADAVAEAEITVMRALSVSALFAVIGVRIANLLKMHKRKHVPMVIVIGKSLEQYRTMLGEIEAAVSAHDVQVNKLERAFNLYHEDWVYHRESLLPPEKQAWLQELGKLQRKFWRLAERIPGPKVYHFFINAPAAFAVGLGALLGGRTTYVLYHYISASATRPYKPVIDFRTLDDQMGPHILKTQIADPRHITVDGADSLPEDYRGDLFLALHIAGHDPRGDVQRLAEQQKAKVVAITSRHAGTIPLDADWLRIACEIASEVLKLAADRRVERLHLFLSIPVVLAFTLGAALGPFVQVSVHNLFPKTNEYHAVIRMEEL